MSSQISYKDFDGKVYLKSRSDRYEIYASRYVFFLRFLVKRRKKVATIYRDSFPDGNTAHKFARNMLREIRLNHESLIRNPIQ